MATFREIVTKAIIGKGKKYFKNSYSMTPEVDVDTVLGCWVINHKFKGYEKNNKIVIEGSFDVNMWYSYDNDTKTAVMNKTIDYLEEVMVNIKTDDDLSTERDIIVRVLKQPNCTKVENKDDVIEFIIEKELGIEIVGETKVKVGIEPEEEPWEEIVDPVVTEEELSPEVEKEIEENIEENYI
ncbi:MAG: outer spore coat protein CotE [Bacilli bacterium]